MLLQWIYGKPVVIRYPRGQEAKEKIEKQEKIELGKAEILQKGKDITILAIGKMVEKAIKVAKKLEKEKKEVEIINVRFLKPLDEETILQSIQKTKKVITIEDNILTGGLASHVERLLIEHPIENVKLQTYGWKDNFVEHGKVEELETLYGLDVESITSKVKELFY